MLEHPRRECNKLTQVVHTGHCGAVGFLSLLKFGGGTG